MSYDHKIIDQKYHLKGLINKDICNELIQFYEDNLQFVVKEESYKFNEDTASNKKVKDNFGALNISYLQHLENFKKPYLTILKYLRIALTNHAMYVRNNLCPTYEDIFMNYTDNIRIIKYGVGNCIKDHTDVAATIRGSLTMNLNDDYEGGEFRFAYLQVRQWFSLLNLFGFMGQSL